MGGPRGRRAPPVNDENRRLEPYSRIAGAALAGQPTASFTAPPEATPVSRLQRRGAPAASPAAARADGRRHRVAAGRNRMRAWCATRARPFASHHGEAGYNANLPPRAGPAQLNPREARRGDRDERSDGRHGYVQTWAPRREAVEAAGGAATLVILMQTTPWKTKAEAPGAGCPPPSETPGVGRGPPAHRHHSPRSDDAMGRRVTLKHVGEALVAGLPPPTVAADVRGRERPEGLSHRTARGGTALDSLRQLDRGQLWPHNFAPSTTRGSPMIPPGDRFGHVRHLSGRPAPQRAPGALGGSMAIPRHGRGAQDGGRRMAGRPGGDPPRWGAESSKVGRGGRKCCWRKGEPDVDIGRSSRSHRRGLVERREARGE